MSRRYSISQARANLPAIVESVGAGEVIELTRRGTPVAAVISIRELERLRIGRLSFAAAYQAFVDRNDLTDVGVEEDHFEARRNVGTGREVEL